jgi:hypothetical protein
MRDNCLHRELEMAYSAGMNPKREFAGGFGRVVGDVTANRLDIPFDIFKLLRKEDPQRFLGVYAHTL